MQFKDLTPYVYLTPKRKPLLTVLNVGWLDRWHLTTSGPVDAAVVEKLTAMIDHQGTRVNQTRGVHDCPWCKTIIKMPDGSYLGTAEIWVPGQDGIVYAAPTLITHYITNHDYQPPAEFVAAVIAFDLVSDWDGNALYEELLRQTGQAS